MNKTSMSEWKWEGRSVWAKQIRIGSFTKNNLKHGS